MKSILIAFLAAAPLHAAPEIIFNGKDLTGWKVQDAPYWTVKDGVLIGESDDKKKNSILWTEKEYGDFTFEGEFRYTGQIDSGVFLRHYEDQIQIGTSRSLKRDMTGSPYIASKKKYPAEAAGAEALLKTGDWNKLRITAKGNVYTIELNGRKVLEYPSETSTPKGPVGLQVHPGLLMKVEYRNLSIEEIKA